MIAQHHLYDWCISILHCSIVPESSYYLSGPLLYRSPVVVAFNRRHSRFRNFNSAIHVDVISMKSYVDSFLDPTCEPVRVSINNLNLVPNWIVAGLVGVFRNGGGVGSGKSYIPIVLFDPLLHRSPCFTDVNFAALAGNPVAGLTVSFRRTKCDRSVVSDVKVVRMPCCSRQRRRGSDTPWI